ncbi:general stress protein YciG [Oxalobacteraceae bacterium GrIS 1.11]
MASSQGSDQGKGGSGSTNPGNPSGQKSTSKRGFAAMDEVLQREIASKGGQAAHQKGTAHEFDSEEARRAGQKGGEAVSRDREHMAEIGRKGGESRQAANREENGKSASATRGTASEQHAKAGKQGSKHDEK